MPVHGLIFWGPSASHMVAEGCLSHGPWLACSLEGMYCSSSPAFLTLREHQPLWKTKCSRPWPLWWPRWGTFAGHLLGDGSVWHLDSQVLLVEALGLEGIC